MASHLIALDKNPGVHPIGIGDTARCIIAKAILNITRQEAAGSIQLALVRYLALRPLYMLQRSLAAAPAVHYRSLIMHCP